jgi:hypothetical protein
MTPDERALAAALVACRVDRLMLKVVAVVGGGDLFVASMRKAGTE